MSSLNNSPLSFGTIFLIIQHLPYPRDVSAMMKTCRILHKAGIKSLLRFGATLETEADIASFCAFVLADVPARAPFVRSIGITIKICIALEEEEDPSDYLSIEGGAAALDSLAQVIRNATNLHALRMDSSDEFLERSPALRDAIAACQNLRCLRLGSIRDMTINLLAAMKSAPSEIELDCIDYKPHRSEPQNLYDVIGKHSETVEKLIVRYADMYQSWEDEAPRFSNIRALVLRDCLIVGLVDLHKVFGRQGIEYLEVSGLIPQWEEYDEDDIPEMEGAWKDVTHLCGCLDALGGSFKLMHPIKRLDIEGVSSQREQLEQLRTLIGDCRPERYLVHPGYGGLVTKFNVKDVPALLPMPEGASTTRLVLDVALSSVAGSPKMFLKGLTGLLSSTSITHFVLRLNESMDPSSTDARALEPTRKWSNRKIWVAFAPSMHETVVLQLAHASDSLAHVVLDIMGSPLRYWVVERNKSANGAVFPGPTLREMSEIAGKEMILRERLGFNDQSTGLGDVFL